MMMGEDVDVVFDRNENFDEDRNGFQRRKERVALFGQPAKDTENMTLGIVIYLARRERRRAKSGERSFIRRKRGQGCGLTPMMNYIHGLQIESNYKMWR